MLAHKVSAAAMRAANLLIVFGFGRGQNVRGESGGRGCVTVGGAADDGAGTLDSVGGRGRGKSGGGSWGRTGGRGESYEVPAAVLFWVALPAPNSAKISSGNNPTHCSYPPPAQQSTNSHPTQIILCVWAVEDAEVSSFLLILFKLQIIDYSNSIPPL